MCTRFIDGPKTFFNCLERKTNKLTYAHVVFRRIQYKNGKCAANLEHGYRNKVNEVNSNMSERHETRESPLCN
jgi:lysozyme family protein